MSAVSNLGYLVIGATDPKAWLDFAHDFMGSMAHEDEQGQVLIRLDDYSYRLLIVKWERDELISNGWATLSHKHFQEVRARMLACGIEVTDSTPEQAASRYVEDFFVVTDPAGNKHEISWGRTINPMPFISPTGVSAFTTGELGFGHAFLPCPTAFEESLAFYQDVFQFEYSDFFRVPGSYAAGLKPGARVFFFHPENARQHSLAIAEMQNDQGIHHFEVEVATLDEVGRAYDKAEELGIVARTLGRHVNDDVVSFYARTPGGFLIEYGYEGKEMNWTNHEVINIPKGSYWGHKWK